MIEVGFLLGHGCRIKHLGRGQVRENAFQLQVWRLPDLLNGFRQIAHADAQARHTRVELQMKTKWFRQRGFRSSFFQSADLPEIVGRRSQALVHDLFRFALPETGEQQHASVNASITQANALFGAGHAEPLDAFAFEHARAAHRAMSVGVGLNHRANSNVGTDVLLNCFQIVPECAARNLRPDRTHEPSIN